jgi:hypothetical protein
MQYLGMAEAVGMACRSTCITHTQQLLGELSRLSVDACKCTEEVLATYSQQGLEPAHCYGWCVCHKAGNNCSIPLHASMPYTQLQLVDGTCATCRHALASTACIWASVEAAPSGAEIKDNLSGNSIMGW